MMKSLTLCSALLLALLLVPAAVADEATRFPLLTATPSCASATVPAEGMEGEAEAPVTNAEVDSTVGTDNSPLFLSTGCDPCRNACSLTSAACKAACGTNWPCIQQCNCDFYWCVDACVHCGEQDPPPAGC